MSRRRTVPPDPHPDELAEGSTGPRVAGLQHVLNGLGYWPDGGPLKVDGQFGPVTASALGAAQAELGVDGEDGRLGSATRAALRRRRDGAGARRSRSVSARLRDKGTGRP